MVDGITVFRTKDAWFELAEFVFFGTSGSRTSAPSCIELESRPTRSLSLRKFCAASDEHCE